MDTISILKRAYRIREMAHDYLDRHVWGRLVHSEIRRYAEDICYIVFWVSDTREWRVNVSSHIATIDAEDMMADTIEDITIIVSKAIRDALNEL